MAVEASCVLASLSRPVLQRKGQASHGRLADRLVKPAPCVALSGVVDQGSWPVQMRPDF